MYRVRGIATFPCSKLKLYIEGWLPHEIGFAVDSVFLSIVIMTWPDSQVCRVGLVIFLDVIRTWSDCLIRPTAQICSFEEKVVLREQLQ